VASSRTDIDSYQYSEVAVSRIQLALNVDDIDKSVAFYSKLFGTEPAKRRPGYANFAIAEPPLKLVLLENHGQGGSLNHLGIEVASTDVVDAEQTRLAAAGLASVDERDSTCCYARQDKFWVQGAPHGERWEIYTVKQDSPTFWGEGDERRWAKVEAVLDAGDATSCCGTDPAAAELEAGPATGGEVYRRASAR
jgi:catechol 2,3-dioxygenase-like lactoylglutathione lyase family enzyme